MFRKPKTLLKKNKKQKPKIENEIQEVEDQFNFMNKFNKDVRERNRVRNLKVSKSRQKRARKNLKKRQSYILSYSFYF